MTPQQALESLLERKINLTVAEREQGSASHNRIRELLSNKADTDSTFPWLMDGDFLSGSFARKTKIRPLDDIDVIVVLDGHGLYLVNNGQIVRDVYVRGGDSPSPVHNLVNIYNMISSQLVLQKIADALGESYPNSTIKPDGQAVNVQFDSYGLGLDIVPAFHILPHSGGDGTYYIPQGDGNDGWMQTNPKFDIAICNSLHEKHNQNFKPVLRLIKYWSDQVHGDLLKPFHIEVIAWKIFHVRQQPITTYTEALNHFFQNLPSHLSLTCPDPAGIGKNIDHYLSLESRNLALQNAEFAKNTAQLACGYELIDRPGNAIKEWEKLFGNLQ